jgi:hypothetical protein
MGVGSTHIRCGGPPAVELLQMASIKAMGAGNYGVKRTPFALVKLMA